MRQDQSIQNALSNQQAHSNKQPVQVRACMV